MLQFAGRAIWDFSFVCEALRKISISFIYIGLPRFFYYFVNLVSYSFQEIHWFISAIGFIKAELLNFNITGIWGWIRLCCGKMFCLIRHLAASLAYIHKMLVALLHMVWQSNYFRILTNLSSGQTVPYWEQINLIKLSLYNIFNVFKICNDVPFSNDLGNLYFSFFRSLSD